MKQKLFFLFITLILLNSCAINNNIKIERGLFCSFSSSSCDDYYKLILKLDSNNIEMEEIILTVGIGQYYCKGKWTYISRNRIIFECDNIPEWDSINNPYYIPPLNWNPYSYNQYIKRISENKMVLFTKIGKKYRKTILQSDWCDCIPEREKSIIIGGKRDDYGSFYLYDHIGSSSWISNSSGTAQQYLVYLPFGETLLDRRANTTWNTMFSFSGKERDLETGYSYFGARYYDAGTSIWLSVDPLAHKYPSMSPYAYCNNSPMILVDPDGRNFTNFEDADGNLVKHIDDGSNAVFRQTGSGTGKHYAFTGYDELQGGANEVNLETAIQEQQQLNNDNPSLQQNGNTTYCSYATQNVMKTVASTPAGKNALITGRANAMIDQMLSGDNPNYISVSQKEATEYAANGGLAIVGYRNPNTQSSGHVATFSVGDNRTESNIIANIGMAKYTGFVPLNSAIAKSKSKSFFIYVPGNVLKSVTVTPK